MSNGSALSGRNDVPEGFLRTRARRVGGLQGSFDVENERLLQCHEGVTAP